MTKINLNVDDYAIWPVYYGESKDNKPDSGEKYRVAAYKDGKVVYERIFNTHEGAKQFVAKQEELQVDNIVKFAIMLHKVKKYED